MLTMIQNLISGHLPTPQRTAADRPGEGVTTRFLSYLMLLRNCFAVGGPRGGS
jgi:hypothetical protein